jgi:uncharacterized repeat protein (TIGR01451 family)
LVRLLPFFPGDPDYFSGPTDQGALFDFGFGTLAPGESRTFQIFYGAAATEAEAENAIATVGAEVFLFGYPTDLDTGEALFDGPNVYIFAFRGVGGTAVGADLSVTKTDFPDPVTVGDNLTYQLTVTNNGPFDATTVTLTDNLLPDVSIVLVTPSQGSCVIANGVVTSDLGTLLTGESATVNIEVNPLTAGVIVNTAIVSSDQPDPAPANNIATENSTVLSVPQSECIRVDKVYDWVVFANRDRNKVPIPDDCRPLVDKAIRAGKDINIQCVEPIVPPPFPLIPKPQPTISPEFSCRVIGIRRETITVGGAVVRVGVVRFLFGATVLLRIFADNTFLCEFPATIQFDDEVVLCLPEPLDESNILCRITAIEYMPIGSVSGESVVYSNLETTISLMVCRMEQSRRRVVDVLSGSLAKPYTRELPNRKHQLSVFLLDLDSL